MLHSPARSIGLFKRSQCLLTFQVTLNFRQPTNADSFFGISQLVFCIKVSRWTKSLQDASFAGPIYRPVQTLPCLLNSRFPSIIINQDLWYDWAKIAPSKCEDRWISLICGISRSLFAWDKKEILNYNLEENYPSYGIHIKNLGYLKCDHYLKSSSSHLKHTKSMMWIPFCLWYGEPVNWWYLKVLCQAKVLPATSTTWDILNVTTIWNPPVHI